MKKSFYYLGAAVLLSILSWQTPSRAEITSEMQDSVVRIFAYDSLAAPDSLAFPVWAIQLKTGEEIDYVPDWSTGTGFIISKDGYILTNNHVIAPESLSYKPQKLIYVVKKVGQRYLLYRGTVVYQDPNRDVAVVHCQDLNSTPLTINFSEPSAGEDVYDIGYPGVADQTSEDLQSSERLKTPLAEALYDLLTRGYVKTYGHRPNKADDTTLAKQAVSMANGWSGRAEWNRFQAALGDFLLKASPNASSWDISDLVERTPLWRTFVTPSTAKGNVLRVTTAAGKLGGNAPTFEIVQHNCTMHHGNSGGPLLNAKGQVLGVVGDGVIHQSSDSVEETQFAASITELKHWFELHNIAIVTSAQTVQPVTTATPSTTPVTIAAASPEAQHVKEVVPTKSNNTLWIAVLSIVAALAVVGAGLWFWLANKKTSAAKPGSGLPTPAASSETVRADLPPVKARSRGKWRLVGRSPDGQNINVDLSEATFANNAGRIVLGRVSSLCHATVDHKSVSRQHAQIRRTESGFTIADRNSANGTAVNGQFTRRPFEEVPFRVGDTLTLGELKLDFTQA
jgi:Trypsin-like peptidase domain/FHA domain